MAAELAQVKGDLERQRSDMEASRVEESGNVGESPGDGNEATSTTNWLSCAIGPQAKGPGAQTPL